MTTTARRWATSFSTFVLLGAALVASAPAGQAQNGKTPLPKSQAEFEKQVGITAAQKTKMNTITKKYEPKAKALQAQMVKLQQQMQTLQVQANKEMQSVLTAQQQAKIKAIQSAMQQQGGMGGPPPGGGKMR